jgi:hypothetical protein
MRGTIGCPKEPGAVDNQVAEAVVRVAAVLFLLGGVDRDQVPGRIEAVGGLGISVGLCDRKARVVVGHLAARSA